MNKRNIIEALAYPRAMVRGGIELDHCVHCGNYAREDRICQFCYHSAECEWLCSNDESISLEEKSIEELESALEFALGYVDAHINYWGHYSRSCQCDACLWLRHAQQLFAKVVSNI